MKNTYQPIACSVYDALEAAAVKNVPVEIILNNTRKFLWIQDLRTKDKAEYLIGKDVTTGVEHVIRLDQIDAFLDAQTKEPLGTDTGS